MTAAVEDRTSVGYVEMTNEVFAEFYARVRVHFLNTARLRLRPDDRAADEVAMDALDDFWRGINRGTLRIEDEGHFQACLFQSLNWAITSYIRARKLREELFVTYDVDELDLGSRHWERSAEDEVCDALPGLACAALERVNGRYATLLWLHHVEGHSEKELADRFGRTVPSINSTTQYGRMKLRVAYAQLADAG
jgi:DNA-directed RNA polymerase specialized sigma24 family protein